MAYAEVDRHFRFGLRKMDILREGWERARERESERARERESEYRIRTLKCGMRKRDRDEEGKTKRQMGERGGGVSEREIEGE